MRIARQRSAVAIATTLSVAAPSVTCSLATPACRACDSDDLPPRHPRNYWENPVASATRLARSREPPRAGRGFKGDSSLSVATAKPHEQGGQRHDGCGETGNLTDDRNAAEVK